MQKVRVYLRGISGPLRRTFNASAVTSGPQWSPVKRISRLLANCSDPCHTTEDDNVVSRHLVNQSVCNVCWCRSSDVVKFRGWCSFRSLRHRPRLLRQHVQLHPCPITPTSSRLHHPTGLTSTVRSLLNTATTSVCLIQRVYPFQRTSMEQDFAGATENPDDDTLLENDILEPLLASISVSEAEDNFNFFLCSY